MKKIFSLLCVVAFSCALSYAGPWVVGANQLAGLLDNIEQGIGDAPAVTPMKLENGALVVDTDYNKDEAELISWSKMTEFTFAEENVNPWYQYSADASWKALIAIDFTGKGYKQTAGTSISLAQPSLVPVDYDEIPAPFTKIEDYFDRYDINWLKTLEFSGNDFSDLVIDGGPYQEFALETINLSNNPNLKSLSITNCANLKVVNLTGTGLSQQDVDYITLDVHEYSPDAQIIYVPASDKKIGISSLVVYVRDNTVYVENKAPEAIVELYDLFGRKLMDSQESFFNISSLAKGVYIVKVSGEATQIVK